MKLRYLKQDQIDKERWDSRLSAAINRNIAAHSWYLDAVAGSWDALVEDDYLSFMPLPQRRKFGLRYIYQPAFAQQLGIFSGRLLQEAEVKQYLNAIPSTFVLADINLNKWIHIGEDLWPVRNNDNYELELITSYEILRSAYSVNLKRNLAKAENEGLKIMDSGDPRQVVELFRQNRGANITSLRDSDYQSLLRLIYQLMHRGMCSVRSVYGARNELIAAAVFAEDSNRSVFLFSALSDEGRKRQAMPLIIDAYIHQHAGSERILDFEGSNDPGLARFYASFGSTAFKYQSLRIQKLPIPLRYLYSVYASWRG